jgi:cation diffusion facilitator CzcD-associated flavoprotein CzcO
MLEERDLIRLDRAGDGFALTFSDGTAATARRVVLAIGVTAFAHLPQTLAALADDAVSHSIAPRRLSDFAGRDVAVIGGGASAVDTAAALHEAGANTTLVARRQAIRFFSPPGARPSLWRRVRHPRSGLGPGLRSRVYSDLPDAFRMLPAATRHALVRRHLGPASLWQMRARIVDKVNVLTGHGLRHAEADGGRVALTLEDDAGTTSRIEADHVVAATGFRVDMARLGFLSPALAREIRVIDGAPELDAGFETSAHGLHVTGAAAATSFGPLMRFMYGADFAARRLKRRLAR